MSPHKFCLNEIKIGRNKVVGRKIKIVPSREIKGLNRVILFNIKTEKSFIF